MGLQDTLDNRKHFYSRIRASLEKLLLLRISTGSFSTIGLLDSHGVIGVESPEEARDAIISGEAAFHANLRYPMVQHLMKNLKIISFYGDLFKLVEQSENAYALAKRLLQHYSQHWDNPKKQRHLSVEVLLDCCSDISAARPEKIRRRFEGALDALARNDRRDIDGGYVPPMITWKYVYQSKCLTAQELRPNKLKHDKWKRLLIEFEVLGFKRGEYSDDLIFDETEYCKFLGKEVLYYNDDSNNLRLLTQNE
jgi:hypothetical protein